MFVKSTLWKSLFGREADKLEHANDDERTYYIIEKEALVNKFVSVPKDKGSLNCASFIAGIVEAVLCDCGFVSIILKSIILYIFISFYDLYKVFIEFFYSSQLKLLHIGIKEQLIW